MRRFPVIVTAVGLLVGLLVVLLPWWRNHSHLRDLYDYGVLMAAAGRVEAGQRPYVDFISPLQSLSYLAAWGAERIFGPSYRALTWGGACFTGATFLLFVALFSRRLPSAIAFLAAAVLTLSTASQHLVVFHNAVGAVCLIAATWAASALVTEEKCKVKMWLAVLAGALWLGGICKINWQLLAITVTGAWILYGALRRRFPPRQFVAMIAGVFFFGVILPVGTELIWTGASPSEWYYNVVQLPAAGNRVDDVRAIFSWKSYLRPPHDYYGTLLIPAVGLLGVLTTAGITVTVCWKAERRGDRVELVSTACLGLLAAVGGASLLVTNYDIAVISLGGWFGLLLAMWNGFTLPARGGMAWGALAALMVLGIVSWSAAWRGQRSQFGHSQSPRTNYVSVDTIGADFHYLRGTLIPPEMAESLQALAQWRHSHVSEAGSLFYAQGLEWLERCWLPSHRIPTRPLWMHFGTTYAGKAEQDFITDLARGAPHDRIVLPLAYSYWPGPAKAVLDREYVRSLLGPVIALHEKIPVQGLTSRPLDFVRTWGGNFDGRFLSTDMKTLSSSSGALFLGVERGTGRLLTRVPVWRVRGRAVFTRSGRADRAATATFTVHRRMADGVSEECWREELVLLPGDSEKEIEAAIAGEGGFLEFRVALSPDALDGVSAGWRNPALLHAEASGPDLPPPLHYGRPGTILTEEVAAQLFEGSWRPSQAVAYGGGVIDGEFVLQPQGELWLRVPGHVEELVGRLRVIQPRAGTEGPALLTVFYKSGRLDLQGAMRLGNGGENGFIRAWSAEPDGWLVLVREADGSTVPVALRIVRP